MGVVSGEVGMVGEGKWVWCIEVVQLLSCVES